MTGQDDSDDWKGRRVTLYRDTTHFQGKTVPCIRVRAADEPAPKKKPKKAAPTGETKPDINDEVGF